MPVALKVSRVQKKGQVTIPSEIRQSLGLEEGDLVTFIQTENGVFLFREVLAFQPERGRVSGKTNPSPRKKDEEEVPATLPASFLFLERLKRDEVETLSVLTPQEGRRIVDVTAGIFRRQDSEQAEDFPAWRRRFEAETAERVAKEMHGS